MNTSHKFCILLVLIGMGTASCTTNKEHIHNPGTGEVNSSWKVPFDGSRSEPVILGGIIYIGSFDGAVYAFDAKSGKEIWRYQTGPGLTSGPEIIRAQGKSFGDLLGSALSAATRRSKGKREIRATPVVEGGIVYVGSLDGSFYAIDAINGKLKWASYTDHLISDKAIVTEKYIIIRGLSMSGRIGARDHSIFSLDRKNGKVKWSTLGAGSATLPALVENRVFYIIEPVNEDDRDLIITVNAADVESGKVLWSARLKGRNPAGPVISHNQVFISASEGGGLVRIHDGSFSPHAIIPHLYAVDASNGDLLWHFKAGDTFYMATHPPTAGEKYLFYMTQKGLFAINKNTGKKEWFLGGKFSPYNISLNKFLYVQGDSTRKDDSLYAINPKTGKVIWEADDENVFYMNLVGDTAYASAGQGLTAINASTGKKLWKFNTGGFFKDGTNVSTRPLIFDNHVVFPTQTNIIWGKGNIQGHLYSIDARTGKAK